MSKPKIYGTCPAGCLWETVHKEDFEKSASLIPQYPDENGRYYLEKGKEYKIVCTKSANEDGMYDFGTVHFTDGRKTIGVDLTISDKYAESCVFRWLDLFEDTNGDLRIVFESAGVRYEHDAGGLTKSDEYRAYIEENEINLDLKVFLYNADATITVQGEQGKDGETPYIGENGNWWVGETDTGVSANVKHYQHSIEVNSQDGDKGYLSLTTTKRATKFTTSELLSFLIEGGYTGETNLAPVCGVLFNAEEVEVLHPVGIYAENENIMLRGITSGYIWITITLSDRQLSFTVHET